MVKNSLKLLPVLVFSVFCSVFSKNAFSQNSSENSTNQEVKAKEDEHKEGAFDPSKLIMEHVLDAHEFHFFSIGDKQYSIPLPVILYSPQRGWTAFSFSRFHHGQEIYNGYKSEEGKIFPVSYSGDVDQSVKVYDLSLSRNVVQMFIALIILVVLMMGIAKKYRKGTQAAPTGWQNAIEPVVTFIRDEVGKPNINKYEPYMPYLLTVFFFILINNLVGLIPGSANVTGNIAFTGVLGIISLIVILMSSNKHFWMHIIWPPGVPLFVKVILIPVEILGLIIKPAALIIRLFANMIAGHIVITCFIMLIFIFGAMSRVAGWGFSPVSVSFTVFVYFIELLVAFIQAFIFTNLTAVFIGQAMEGAHSDAHGGQDDTVII
ncbi:MAG: F0F1 ATP synthase subunit A [Chitinophagaceae bacterium]|jgi:F-type H+-transporting ATPase subunit a|nr:F0F1 ATP synthase subunit A [Chitinophagaceae bacterium]